VKKKIPNRPKGFSLIELMVVVGIIGILAAMSIPDYISFNTRAKQTEVKVNLGGIYTTESSYFAENGSYIADGDKLGWTPEGRNLYFYQLSLDPLVICNAEGGSNCFKGAGKDMASTVGGPDSNAPDPGASQLSFTAVAFSNLDIDPTIDTWMTNDTKSIIMIRDDSRN